MGRLRGILLAPGLALGAAAPAAAQIVADHTVVAHFAAIPDPAIQAASALRLMFRHASVGTTIDNALNCLQGTRANPTECTRYPPYRYDRRSWSFEPRPNSGWYAKVDEFVTEVGLRQGSFEVMSFKLCYLDGLDGLREPCGSPLNQAAIDQAWDHLRGSMEQLEAAHPGKRFVWWTIPLTQVGQQCTEELNGRIRAHVQANGKALLDIADIECHDEAGLRHTNAQGWEVAYRPYCGEQRPGAQACHPNWTGSLLIGKALWWLMARLGGWDPGCPAERVADLALTEAGPDLAFWWTDVPGAAGGYHLYQTDRAEDLRVMRDTHPLYDPFQAEGPAPGMPVVFRDGLARGLAYYQVLAVCADGVSEGPS